MKGWFRSGERWVDRVVIECIIYTAASAPLAVSYLAQVFDLQWIDDGDRLDDRIQTFDLLLGVVRDHLESLDVQYRYLST